MSGPDRGGKEMMVSVRRVAWVAVLMIVSVGLQGCALLGGGAEPRATYELAGIVPPTGSTGRRQLLIPEPNALKALGDQNIVVMPTPLLVQYLEGAQWSDRLPLVVQARLLEAFQEAGVQGVGKPGDGLAIDYQLVTSIRRFSIDATGPETARVEISARLLNDRNGNVVRQQTFEASSAVTGSGNDAYVAALNAAFELVASDMVGWTLGII